MTFVLNKYLHLILFAIKFFVFSSKTNILFNLVFAIYFKPSLINLEAKFTTSPNIEYSLLLPTVPQTPVKQVPVVNPIEHCIPNLLNSCKIVMHELTASRASFLEERGGNPHATSMTLPLSSIKNLFKAPLVL